jgi:hypothetical protein
LQNDLRQQIAAAFARIRSSHLSESFLFVVNEAVIESDLAEAAALWSAVREQLSFDGCARKFVVSEEEIESADINSLQFLVSGETISIR